MGNVCSCCTKDRVGLQLLALFSISAFFFSLLSVVSCRFFEYQVAGGNQQAGGLFRYSYRHETCVTYETSVFNASSETSRAFGIMANIFGGVALVLVFAMQCFMPPGRWWKSLAYCYLLAFFCQPFTFLIWKQLSDQQCSKPDTDCSLGLAGIFSMVATALYFILGVSSWISRPPASTAYQCPLLVQWWESMVHWSGITRKKGIVKNLKSSSLMQIAILVAGIAALAFTVVTVFDCRFIDAKSFDNNLHFGLYQYYYPPEDTCLFYELGDHRSFFTSTKAAQAFGVIAIVFGAVLLTFLLLMVLLLNFPEVTYRLMPLLAFLSGVSESLTFLMFREFNTRVCNRPNQSCSIARDGILAIVATCLYFLMIPGVYFAGFGPSEEVAEDEAIAPKTAEEAGEEGLDKQDYEKEA